MVTDKIILSDKGKIALKYMQEHDQLLVGIDLIDILGKGLYPVLSSLIRKNLVENVEPETRDFTNSKGEVKQKEYKTYRLTEFGRYFNIED